jgi:AcrR family transcriptional regulator
MKVHASKERKLRHAETISPIATMPRVSTKSLLIDVGEWLFGLHGFDGISLREIAAAAGQRNCNVVQYHFSDKRGLVSAILRQRAIAIDALRRERFDALKGTVVTNLSPRDLLKVIWLPDMSIVGRDGSHPYARFVLQHQLRLDAGEHPFYTMQSNSRKVTASAEGNRSCLFHVSGLLRKHYPQVSRKIFLQRIKTLSMMFLSSVVEHDNAYANTNGTPIPAYNVEPILVMSMGALSAPE